VCENDGMFNLMGVLCMLMVMCGYCDIVEFNWVELMIVLVL